MPNKMRVVFVFQGQCLSHAQHCVKQARLIFLQAQLLSSGTQVLNLESHQVKTFIENHDKFYEVRIDLFLYYSESFCILAEIDNR